MRAWLPDEENLTVESSNVQRAKETAPAAAVAAAAATDVTDVARIVQQTAKDAAEAQTAAACVAACARRCIKTHAPLVSWKSVAQTVQPEMVGFTVSFTPKQHTPLLNMFHSSEMRKEDASTDSADDKS